MNKSVIRWLAPVVFAVPMSAIASTIGFESDTTTYELRFTRGVLKYRSATLAHTFPNRKCSKALIEGFWKEKERFAQSLPPSAPFKADGTVRLNNRVLVVPRQRRNELSSVPKEIPALIVRESSVCAG